MDWLALGIVIGCGAIGGLVNVFLDETGFHLPTTEHDVWRPGWIGIVFVGIIAAAGSWLMTTTGDALAAKASHTLPYGSLATALLTGFGGSKWFRSEGDTKVYRRAAALAAASQPDESAAIEIAHGTPMQALDAAAKMQR